jgi:hypothetical protein
MEQMCIKSYIYHGHPFHLYVYQDTEGIPAGTTVLDGNEIVPSSRIFTYEGGGFGHKSYAGFADMFRYRLLLAKGNWWVDTDSICLKPFDFASEYVFSSELPLPNTPMVNCGNLKAPANSPIYRWLCEQSENVNVNMKWGTIGPALMKQAVAKFGFQDFVQPPEVFCPVPYDWKCDTLLNGNRSWSFTPASYAVHLWNEAWRGQNLNKDAKYDPKCLYEQLKNRYEVMTTGPAVLRPVARAPAPAFSFAPPVLSSAWKDDIVMQKLDRLRKLGFDFVAVIPARANREGLAALFPTYIEEVVQTPEGIVVLFCAKTLDALQ